MFLFIWLFRFIPLFYSLWEVRWFHVWELKFYIYFCYTINHHNKNIFFESIMVLVMTISCFFERINTYQMYSSLFSFYIATEKTKKKHHTRNEKSKIYVSYFILKVIRGSKIKYLLEHSLKFFFLKIWHPT